MNSYIIYLATLNLMNGVRIKAYRYIIIHKITTEKYGELEAANLFIYNNSSVPFQYAASSLSSTIIAQLLAFLTQVTGMRGTRVVVIVYKDYSTNTICHG